MHEQVKYIVKYQETDRKLKAIEDELNTSEEAKKYFVARKFLSTVKDSLLELDQKAKTVTENYNASLVEAKKLIDEAKAFESSVESSTDENELNYLKKKFQEACEKVSQAEAKIEKLSKEMNDLYKEFSELGKKNKLMKAQYDEYSPKLEELKNSKKEEVLALRAELKKIESKIDSELMNKYSAKRKDKVFPIVFGYDVQSKSAYCPHCATGMSIGFVNALNAGEVKECESCHRLIYAFDSAK